jgi:uncharacterized protein YgiM (DUF1202 family)
MRKNIIRLLAVCVLLALLPALALADRFAVVKGGRLNLREYPSASSYSLGKYETGTWVIAGDASNGWCRVRTLNGKSGYMSASYLDFGGYNGGTVFLRSSGADEQGGAWSISLNKGEQYVTRPAIIGCINGGFDDAVRTLLEYKRKDSLISFENRDIPIVFNDYMDCLWCRRSEEKMTRLIDAAAEAGCETFCIDAGWYKNKNEGANWSETIGD